MTEEHTKAAAEAPNQPRGLFVGLATLDVVYRVVEIPTVDEKVVALSQELAAGGPAANAAVTFAALGGRAVLVTSLGLHPFGRQARDHLEKHGVEVIDATPELTDPPAVATVLVKDSTGERSIVSLGATHQDVLPPERLAKLVEKTDVLLLDGHHPAMALVAARAAATAELPIVLDAGSWKPCLDELLPLASDCIASARFRTPEWQLPQSGLDISMELRVVTEIEQRMAAGRRHLKHRVACTAGSGAITFFDKDGRPDRIAAPKIQAVDTLGAGDVFHGAYAFVTARYHSSDDLLKVMELEDALHFAACAASLRCTMHGQRAWLKTGLFDQLRRYGLSSRAFECFGFSELDHRLAPWPRR